MSNYGLFVKGKMLGARQRNKVNGQGYYNEILYAGVAGVRWVLRTVKSA